MYQTSLTVVMKLPSSKRPLLTLVNSYYRFINPHQAMFYHCQPLLYMIKDQVATVSHYEQSLTIIVHYINHSTMNGAFIAKGLAACRHLCEKSGQDQPGPADVGSEMCRNVRNNQG